MRGIYMVPVALFLLLAGLFVIALFLNDKNELPSMLVGHEIRSFDLPALNGTSDNNLETGRITEEVLKDGGMTVVNFWASWCGPCRIEHVQLMTLRARGVRILGINYKDEKSDALKFIDDLGDPFQRIAVDRDGRVGIDWGITGVPETFVVDGTGHVIHRIVGPLLPSDMKDVLEMVQSSGPR